MASVRFILGAAPWQLWGTCGACAGWVRQSVWGSRALCSQRGARGGFGGATAASVACPGRCLWGQEPCGGRGSSDGTVAPPGSPTPPSPALRARPGPSRVPSQGQRHGDFCLASGAAEPITARRRWTTALSPITNSRCHRPQPITTEQT